METDYGLVLAACCFVIYWIAIGIFVYQVTHFSIPAASEESIDRMLDNLNDEEKSDPINAFLIRRRTFERNRRQPG